MTVDLELGEISPFFVKLFLPLLSIFLVNPITYANVICSTDIFGNASCSDGSMKTSDRYGNTTETGTDSYGNSYVEMCSSDRFGNTTCTR